MSLSTAHNPFQNNAPFLHRITLSKKVTINERHKCFGFACIRKLVLNNHQIRVIKVAQRPGVDDTFFLNKLSTRIKRCLPRSKIFDLTPNKQTN